MKKPPPFEHVDAGTPRALFTVARGPSGTVITAGEQRTLLRSIDGARSFRPIEVDADARFGFSHIVALPGGVWWLVGAGGFVFSSLDDGASWRRHEAGPGHFQGVWASGAAVVIVGDDEGKPLFLRSTDRGATWVRLALPPGCEVAPPMLLEVAPSSLVAFGRRAPLLRSTDHGATWLLARTSDASGYVLSGCSPMPGVFIAMQVAGRLLSRDGGETIVDLPAPSSGRRRAVAAAPSSLVMCGTRGGLWRSLDEGATWKPLRSHVDRDLHDVHADAQMTLAVGDLGTVVRGAPL